MGDATWTILHQSGSNHLGLWQIWTILHQSGSNHLGLSCTAKLAVLRQWVMITSSALRLPHVLRQQTWTILHQSGSNHLGLRCNVLPAHKMALITSGCGRKAGLVGDNPSFRCTETAPVHLPPDFHQRTRIVNPSSHCLYVRERPPISLPFLALSLPLRARTAVNFHRLSLSSHCLSVPNMLNPVSSKPNSS